MPYVASTNHLFKELTAYVVQIAALWSSEAKSLAWELGRRLRMSADHGSSMAKWFGHIPFIFEPGTTRKNDLLVIVF